MDRWMEIGGWGVLALGAVVVAWALWWDRSRGRRRCGGCWYRLEDVVASAGVVTCPECGRRHAKVRAMLKTRRRWRWVVVGVMLIGLSYTGFVGREVRQRGWVAAVPTWVLVVGPMDGDLVQATRWDGMNLEWTAGWPVVMTDELALRRKKLWSVRRGKEFEWPAIVRGMQVAQMERGLSARGLLWARGAASTRTQVVLVEDLSDVEAKLRGWRDAVQKRHEREREAARKVREAERAQRKDVWICNDGGGVFILNAEHQIAEAVGSCVQGAVANAWFASATRGGPQFPKIRFRVEGPIACVWGDPAAIAGFDGVMAAVREVLRERDGWGGAPGRRSSVVGYSCEGVEVVVRATDDLMGRLPDAEQGGARQAIEDRYNDGSEEGYLIRHKKARYAITNSVLEGGQLMISVQTPGQRARMDEDLVVWRRELGV